MPTDELRACTDERRVGKVGEQLSLVVSLYRACEKFAEICRVLPHPVNVPPVAH